MRFCRFVVNQPCREPQCLPETQVQGCAHLPALVSGDTKDCPHCCAEQQFDSEQHCAFTETNNNSICLQPSGTMPWLHGLHRRCQTNSDPQHTDFPLSRLYSLYLVHSRAQCLLTVRNNPMLPAKRMSSTIMLQLSHTHSTWTTVLVCAHKPQTSQD